MPPHNRWHFPYTESSIARHHLKCLDLVGADGQILGALKQHCRCEVGERHGGERKTARVTLREDDGTARAGQASGAVDSEWRTGPRGVGRTALYLHPSQ